MKYSDMQRLDKIIEKTEALLNYIRTYEITEERILSEEPVQWAITTPLYNIGEQAYNLSADFKSRYPDIPWIKIAGMRHRLVHDYEDTNWLIVSKTIFEVLPDFLNKIRKIKDAE